MPQAHSRDPFGAAIGAIRAFMHEGRFAAGAPLIVSDLAVEIGLSTTPLREALACLAGEGLIERRRGRGYFSPTLSPADLIDLFGVQHGYALSALATHRDGSLHLQRAAAAASPAPDFVEFMDALLNSTANQAMIQAHFLVASRLSSATRAERALDPRLPNVVADLYAAASRADISRLRTLLTGRYDWRRTHAADIARGVESATDPVHLPISSGL